MKLALFRLREERSGRKRVFLQNEPISKLPISVLIIANKRDIRYTEDRDNGFVILNKAIRCG